MSGKIRSTNGDDKATYYEIELSDGYSIRIQPEKSLSNTEIKDGVEIRVGTEIVCGEMHLTKDEAKKLKQAIDESI